MGKLSLQILPVLRVRRALSLDEYADLAFSYADRLGCKVKNLQYLLRFVGGCIQRLRVASSAVVSLQASNEASNNSDSSRSQALKRKCWEGCACIANTTVADLLPIWGLDAYRVYDALAGKWIVGRHPTRVNWTAATNFGLSGCAKLPVDRWIPIGREIARRLPRPERQGDTITTIFDPVLVSSRVTGKE